VDPRNRKEANVRRHVDATGRALLLVGRSVQSSSHVHSPPLNSGCLQPSGMGGRSAGAVSCVGSASPGVEGSVGSDAAAGCGAAEGEGGSGGRATGGGLGSAVGGTEPTPAVGGVGGIAVCLRDCITSTASETGAGSASTRGELVAVVVVVEGDE